MSPPLKGIGLCLQRGEDDMYLQAFSEHQVVHRQLGTERLPGTRRQAAPSSSSRILAARVAEFRQMHETLDDIETQSEKHASASWTRSLEIHRQVVQASGNDVLSSIYELIITALKRNQVPYLPYIADWQEEIQSHRRLIDVLAQGDPDAMASELTEHLAHAERYRLDLLKTGFSLNGGRPPGERCVRQSEPLGVSATIARRPED